MTKNEAYRLGLSAPKGARCPLTNPELAAEWTKGRDQARRIERMDLRPAFRKSGNRFARYTPSHCK